MFDSVFEDFRPTYQQMIIEFGPVEVTGQPGAGVVRADVNELTPALRAEFDAFVLREIAIAQASVACDDLGGRQAIRHEYERRFIDENEDALAKLTE